MCDDIQRANIDFVNRTIRQLPTNTVQICFITAAIMAIVQGCTSHHKIHSARSVA